MAHHNVYCEQLTQAEYPGEWKLASSQRDDEQFIYVSYGIMRFQRKHRRGRMIDGMMVYVEADGCYMHKDHEYVQNPNLKPRDPREFHQFVLTTNPHGHVVQVCHHNDKTYICLQVNLDIPRTESGLPPAELFWPKIPADLYKEATELYNKLMSHSPASSYWDVELKKEPVLDAEATHMN